MREANPVSDAEACLAKISSGFGSSDSSFVFGSPLRRIRLYFKKEKPILRVQILRNGERRIKKEKQILLVQILRNGERRILRNDAPPDPAQRVLKQPAQRPWAVGRGSAVKSPEKSLRTHTIS